MILGEKEFKKPNFDELGQNRKNIENWRRNLDQRVESSWKNHEENPWMMSILEDLCEFQWFWAVLEERKKKEEFWTLRRIFRNWQIGPLGSIWALT